MRGTGGTGLWLAVLLATATGAGALTPTEKCEVDKLKAAGKYGFCRLKAEAKAVKNTALTFPPGGCVSSPTSLSPQELVLAFMVFDISSCVGLAAP